jgi:hypothetical protein
VFAKYQLLSICGFWDLRILPLHLLVSVLLISAYSRKSAIQIAIMKSKVECDGTIQTYREMLVLNNWFRDCFSSFLLPFVQSSILASLSFGGFLVIRFHKYLSFSFLFIIAFEVISLLLGVFYTLTAESALSTRSEAFIRLLKMEFSRSGLRSRNTKRPSQIPSVHSEFIFLEYFT